MGYCQFASKVAFLYRCIAVVCILFNICHLASLWHIALSVKMQSLTRVSFVVNSKILSNFQLCVIEVSQHRKLCMTRLRCKNYCCKFGIIGHGLCDICAPSVKVVSFSPRSPAIIFTSVVAYWQLIRRVFVRNCEPRENIKSVSIACLAT